MKDITDVDYAQAKKVCKDSDIFENFRNVCLKIDQSKIFTDIDTFFMVEECIKGRICHSV